MDNDSKLGNFLILEISGKQNFISLVYIQLGFDDLMFHVKNNKTEKAIRDRSSFLKKIPLRTQNFKYTCI